MKAGLTAVILILLVSVRPAFAHRLDEYLQAATVTLEKDHVEIQMRLTPGVEVFPKLIGDIDTDRDGTLSDAEQHAYADSVLRDLSLAVDGKPVSIRLKSFSFPAVELMREGTGDIVLELRADLPAGNTGRTLTFDNRHRPDISVYLANCLVPENPDLHITGQDRSYDQSHYVLKYTQQIAGTAPVVEPSTGVRSWIDRFGGWSLFRAYFYQGVHHILTGYDHLLFVSALVLAATTLWELIKVVSTFTIAHTITLLLAALNLVHLSGRVVEPLISASIVFVALQNVFWPRQSKGWTRLGAAFFFGLFHGLGFAGGLLEAMREMPGGTMFLAIAAFSLGVEAGHQMVVLPLFGMLKAARRTRPDAVARAKWSMAVQRGGSAVISVAGVYYLFLALTGNV